MKKFLRILICAATLFLVFSSCKKQPTVSDSIVGDWSATKVYECVIVDGNVVEEETVNVSFAGVEMILSIEDDKTFSGYVIEDGEGEELSGTWSRVGDKLLLNSAMDFSPISATIAFEIVSVTDSELVLRMDYFYDEEGQDFETIMEIYFRAV